MGSLDGSLARVLAGIKGKEPLAGASCGDVAAYERHWCKAAGAEVGAASMSTSSAARYLAAELVDGAAVDAVLQHLGVGEAVTRQQFRAAAHLLSAAVRDAQDAIFSTDDAWADAPAAESRKQRPQEQQKRDSWSIGSMAAAAARPAGASPAAAAAPAAPAGRDAGGEALSWESSAEELALSVRADDASPQVLRTATEGPAAEASPELAQTPDAAAAWRDDVEEGGAAWGEFDAAFAQLDLERPPAADAAAAHADAATAAQPPPASEWAAFVAQQGGGGGGGGGLSLAGAGALLAVGLPRMSESDRRRCEEAYAAKGYAAAGGASQADAGLLFARSGLGGHLFAQLWAATGAAPHAPLALPQFCAFVHLMHCAARGRPPPAGLTPAQAAQLVGPGAAGFAAALDPPSAGNGILVDGSKLGAAIRQEAIEDDDAGDPDGGEEVHGGGGEEVHGGGGAINGGGGTTDPHLDSSDATSTCSRSSLASSWRSGAAGPAAAGGAPAAPPPPALPPRLARAAWAEQAGGGHARLGVRLVAACAPAGKPLDRPFLTLSLRDAAGRLVELPQDSHPGLHARDSGAIRMGGQELVLATPLGALPPGAVLFVELRQWKARERRFSTVGWSFVRLELVVDSGPAVSRVRAGPLVMPLYRKPLDVSLQRRARLATRGAGVEVEVMGRGVA